MIERTYFQEFKSYHGDTWWAIRATIIILVIGIPICTLIWVALEAETAEYKAGIETLSCPEIKFLIQYGDFEHHGNEMILEVWVDKC